MLTTHKYLTHLSQITGVQHLTPDIVLDYAADPLSDIHNRFNWSSGPNMYGYRLWQAQKMLDNEG